MYSIEEDRARFWSRVEKIRRDVDFRLKQIDLAIDLGCIPLLIDFMSAKSLAPEKIADNARAQEVVARAQIWLEEARAHEATHGEGSKLNRNHPFITNFL